MASTVESGNTGFPKPIMIAFVPLTHVNKVSRLNYVFNCWVQRICSVSYYTLDYLYYISVILWSGREEVRN